MTLDTRDIGSALLKKGFEENDDGDHKRFKYPKSNIVTKLSHGHHDIGDPLIKLMAAQIRLSKAQFVELIKCTYSGESYKTNLEGQGAMLPEPTAETPANSKGSPKKKRKKN